MLNTKLKFLKHSFLLIALIINFLGFAADISNQQTTIENDPAAATKNEIPDPLELYQSWWEYFNVSPDKLPDRAKTFLNTLDDLKRSLNETEHRSLLTTMDQIHFNLDILIKKKQLADTLPPTHLQFLKNYTIEQLLKVNKNYLQIQARLISQRDKLTNKKSELSRINSRLDEIVLSYRALPKFSFPKLKKGLEIIEKRIELAIVEMDIDLIKEKIVFFETEKSRLSEELLLAQERISFDGHSEEMIYRELQAAEADLERSKNDLFLIQKKAFYEEREDPENDLNCCLWTHKILSQSVETELSRVHRLLREMKYHLFVVVTKHSNFSPEKLQSIVNRWKKTISESSTNIKLWEQHIKDEQARIGKEVANTFQLTGSSENGGVVSGIHLEVDRALSFIQELKMQIFNAELLNKQMEWYLIKEKNLLETSVILIKNYAYQLKEFLNNFGNITLFRNHNTPVTLLSIIKAIAIIIAAYFFSKLVRNVIIQKKYIGTAISRSTEYILTRCLHYSIITIGVFISLTCVGLDFTNFVIIASALGVGIGFGLQSMANNVLSGFSLLFQRNIKIGDIIELENNLIGRVIAINLQNTHIKSFEGIDLIVPNSQLTGQMLNNWTLSDSFRRYRVPFRVEYGTDKNFIKEIVIQAANKVPCTMKGDIRFPNPQVWMTGFGDSGINFELVVWVDLSIPLQNGTAMVAYNWEIETVLRENGITMPFPQREFVIREHPKNEKRHYISKPPETGDFSSLVHLISQPYSKRALKKEG